MLITPLKIALASLRRNKTRTGLTVLGIVIGIGAVISVISAGQGIKGLVLNQLESFGTDVIDVEIKVPATDKTSSANAMGIAMGIEITSLKLSDEEALRRLPNIKNSYASVIGQQLVSYDSQNRQIFLMGVSAPFIDVDKTTLAQGRFFTEDEDRSLQNVAVIGSKVKEKIFNDREPIDQLIKIGRQKFRVIGVMSSRGATFGFDLDDMIYVPVRTLQKKVMGIDHVTMMMFQVYDNTKADETAAEMTDLLRQRHGITDPSKDDFHATPIAEAVDILNTVFGAITLLLVAIAGISLLVGGVGIMNIMYVSVIERTYEIGLRKAVGAKNSAIMTQFLWEAILITFLGALLGVAFGIALAWLVAIVAASQHFAWPFVILPSSLLLASGVAIAIGLIFGVFPARAASKMDPVTALRYHH